MKKPIAVFLSGLILAANLGLGVSKHLCGGEVVEQSLSFGQANLGCGMADESCKEQVWTANTILPQPCCADVHSKFSGPETFQRILGFQDLLPKALQFPLPWAPAFHMAATLPRVQSEFPYRPPIPTAKESLSILFQVFRL